MTKRLVLRVRTPARLVLDTPVRAVRVEDRSGWFGIGPGRVEIVAPLPVGILTYKDESGAEGFVAVGGGLLHMHGEECRVMVRDAMASRDLQALGGELERYVREREERIRRERDIIGELTREALRRLAQEVRS